MPNDKFLKIEVFQLLHLDDVDACRVIADIQFYGLAVGLDVADSLAKQVENSTEALLADRNSDGAAKINSICSADKSVCGTHGNASDDVIADLLCHLGDQSAAINIDLDGIEQCRQLALLEPDVKDRTCYLYYLADMFFTH